MLHASASLFALVLSLAAITTQDIEKSFLLNDPGSIHARFSTQARINIYLPEPVSFSDQLSDEQAFFLFQNIFARYSTLEFFPESEPPLISDEGRSIFQARWSFRDRTNNDRFVFRVFFLLQKETPQTSGGGPRPRSPGLTVRDLWKITEIKAEKI